MMGQNDRLLVRLRIGHRSQLIDPPLPNQHTHRWTVFVRKFDDTEFQDRSFVEKVRFELHADFPRPKRTVERPPFEVSETGYAGFGIPLTIWIAGKPYKVQYDLNLTMEKEAEYAHTTTISIANYTPEFYSIAKRMGAVKDAKRSRERELGIPGLDEPPSLSSPPEKIRKKDRSADVSARNSPVPPYDRLKVGLGDKDQRKAESSISPPVRAEKVKREQTATPPLRFTPSPMAGGGGGEKEKGKKKENKLLGFVKERERPSPSPSPTVEKLKREEKEKRKDPRGPSASPSTSTAVERLKKEERKKEKDKVSSPSPSTSAPPLEKSEKLKQLERKLEKSAQAASIERKKEKEKVKDFVLTPSPPEKEKEKKREKEKDVDRLPTISPPEKKEKEKERKEKRDDSRPSSAAGGAVEKTKKDKEKREKEKDPPSLAAEPSSASKRDKENEKDKDPPSLAAEPSSASKRDREKEKDPPSLAVEPSSASKRDREKEKERKKDKQKDRDRPKDSFSSSLMPSLSISVKGDKERERRNPPSITPPPVLQRQECAPSARETARRSTSPPTLVPISNGRSSDYASSSRPSSSAYGSAAVGTVAASQPTSTASALPSLLQQPSPCGSQGGRETPSEKASGRSSISPGLRNEETASSGGSSASSHSSERREQKRIPKLAPSQRERDALSAPLASVDAVTVRRRIDSLTDEEKIFEIALLLLDLDDSSHISEARNSLPALTYDLSKLDQKDLLKLDSLLSGS